MASGSLGTLTLDLIARIGGFIAPLDKAERAATKAASGIGGAADAAAGGLGSLSAAASAVAAAVSGISVGAIFSTFITNTIDAENEQVQLAAVLKSTGSAAGYTRDQLNGMADAMADATSFSGGDISQAQTALLAFTGIVGKEFPRALQSAADMASRTGSTIQQSAETIGRALDVPSAGLTALSKQGFRFTEDQKKLVDTFESVGDVASAQGIVLQGLESTYGGAAAAARDTLGGAIEVVTNSFNDLLTKSGGLDSAKEALIGISDALKTPAAADGLVLAARAAAALATVLTVRLAASAASAVAAFIAMQAGTFQVQLALARMAGVSTSAAIALTTLTTAARAASAAMAFVGGPVGVAILAASALAYFATSSSDASAGSTELAQKVDYLGQSFDGLTKNQAQYSLKGLSAEFRLQKYAVSDAQNLVNSYKQSIESFPSDGRVKEWTSGLIEQSSALDTAKQKLEALSAQMNVLNGILAAPVSIAASKVYTDLSGKIEEQILVADKKSEAEKLQARISAGLIKGLKEGEGDLLVAKQKNLDAIEASVAASRKADEDAKSEAKNAAAAAAEAIQRGNDAITGYQRQIELIDETTGAQAKATEASKVAFDTEYGKLNDISAAQKENLKGLAAELDAKKALQKANDEETKAATYLATLKNENASISAGFDMELAGTGMGDKARDRLKQDMAIQEDYTRKAADLQAQRNSGDISAELYAKETGMLSDALAERMVKQQDYYNQVDEAQSKWMEGVSDAWQNYVDAAENYSAIAADFVSGSLDDLTGGLGGVFSDVVTGAKDAGDAIADFASNMGKSVINALSDMAAQWLVYQGIQLLVGKSGQSAAATGLIANAQASSAQAALNAYASTAGIPLVGPALAPAAALAATAATAPMVAAVSASALAGMAHNGMDNIPKEGTWLLDGGERVLNPNQNRDLTKYLADKSGGAGGGGSPISISVPVTVQGQPGMSDAEAASQGRAIGESAAQQVRQVLQQEMRQGGLLWRRA
ncbi:phage tail tape measure protein [Pseudomonas amygdali]|uniref:Lambda family phage tail tape measure protein n=1 Tax=Pseudomonas amygdali pv. eriobotryae TaxID=129137 RepID=A0A3M3AQN2_PSEA0|nr:phage tail tape measure protein [Pseudomonas amygdali]RMM02760.1 Lambda family phage tail tape measure protein [Pseudomonas amygdali pv. eriobotryae]